MQVMPLNTKKSMLWIHQGQKKRQKAVDQWLEESEFVIGESEKAECFNLYLTSTLFQKETKPWLAIIMLWEKERTAVQDRQESKLM